MSAKARVLTALFALVAASALALAPRAAAQSLADCGAATPAVGSVIRGPVLQVVDAATVCVAMGPRPEAWLKLSLSPGRHPHSRPRARELFAQTVRCRVIASREGGVLGRCVRVSPDAPSAIEVSDGDW